MSLRHTPTLITTLQRSLGTRSDCMVTLDDMRDALGERAFGFLLMLSLAPCLIPLPGMGSVFGVLVALLGLQLVFRVQAPLMPRFILRREFRQQGFHQFLDKIKPYEEKLTRWVRPRYTYLIEGPAESVAGLFIMLMAVPIVLPAPLSNLLPAIVLLMLAVALLERDGLLALVAYAVGILGLCVMFSVYGGILFALWTALSHLMRITV